LTRRILIFHNAFANKGKSRVGLAKIKVLLHMEKLQSYVLETLANADDNRIALQKAFDEFNPTEIWVSGGDGTLYLLLNSLPHSMWHLPVAVLPTGSGNDFIKNYLNNHSLNNALQAALSGKTSLCDVWQCNNLLFIHGLGIGFDGQVVESMIKRKTLFKGFLGYYYHVIGQLLRYREKEFVLEANNQKTAFNCFMITIGNSTTFGGGFKITPKAKINDGLLDVCAISAVPVLKRPLYLKKVEHGSHLHLPMVNYFTADKITINTQQIVAGHIDGELFYDSCFEIKKHPVPLNIITG
jgi:diacylglycerol kinase (ATP)